MMANFGSARMGFRNVAQRDADGKPETTNTKEPKAEKAEKGALDIPAATTNHNVSCALCKTTITGGVRFRCITCANVDVCEKCRGGDDSLHSRKGGQHLMFHIPNTVVVSSYLALDPSKTEWKHNAWLCGGCRAKPIVGERYFCDRCTVTLCGACLYSTNHPTNHPMQVHQKPLEE